LEAVETMRLHFAERAGDCAPPCDADAPYCECRMEAQAALKALEDAGLVVISRLALSFPYALLGADSQKEAAGMGINLDPAAPTPSRTEEGDGW
jgi:hypothetical protein